MLPTLIAVAAGVGPAERDYRVTVRAAPIAAVALRAQTPPGWIAAFCTPSVCAPGHVVVHVPQTGRSTIALHVYRVEDGAARRGNVVITVDSTGSLTLPAAF